MPPETIAAYLATLRRELAFDPPLCARVCAEVQDHLFEAIEADPAGHEAGAVVRFGSARVLAEQYRVLALFTRMRRSGLILVLAVAAVFAAMEARLGWYALTQWSASAELRAITAVVLPIDRYAFFTAAGCGLAGWLYALLAIPSTRRSVALGPLRRCQLLMRIAALAIALAVGIEIFLSLYRFAEAGASAAVLLPAATILLEAGCVLAVALSLRNTAQRLNLLPH